LNNIFLESFLILKKRVFSNDEIIQNSIFAIQTLNLELANIKNPSARNETAPFIRINWWKSELKKAMSGNYSENVN
jgi:hypothetical protein